MQMASLAYGRPRNTFQYFVFFTLHYCTPQKIVLRGTLTTTEFFVLSVGITFKHLTNNRRSYWAPQSSLMLLLGPAILSHALLE